MRHVAFMLLLTVISLFSFASDPQLAVGLKDEIQIQALNGRQIRRIPLPARLESGFCLREGVVAFFGDDYRMHWYRIDEKREIPLPQGPYLYAGKSFGPEVCRNLDLDVERGQMIFEVKPLWVQSQMGLSKQEFDELDEYAEICLLDTRSGTVRRLSGGSGYVWRPWIRHGRVVFSSPAGVGVRQIDQTRPLGLNRVFASRFHRQSDVFLETLALEGKELVMVEYAGSDLDSPRVLGIWAFHLERETWRSIHKFSEQKTGNVLEFSIVADISPDFRYLLLEVENDAPTWFRPRTGERRTITTIPGPVFVRFMR